MSDADHSAVLDPLRHSAATGAARHSVTALVRHNSWPAVRHTVSATGIRHDSRLRVS